MNNNLKSVFKAIGFAVIALILANLIYFLIEFSKTNTAESWNFSFKYGVFSLNEKLVGLKLWSARANGLMLLVFIVTVVNEFRKGNLKLN